YATLSTFLVKNRYKRGAIDKTLFIKRDKKDIMLVQVYVDYIIFGSTRKSWCDEFEALMKRKFQMKILKKSNLMSVKHASTPIETHKPLTKDEEAADVDVYFYRFQVTPKTSHLYVVKRIFRYLKGKPTLGLWYPKESSFNLVAYSDSDYGGANLDRKSTIGADLLTKAFDVSSLFEIISEQKDFDNGDSYKASNELLEKVLDGTYVLLLPNLLPLCLTKVSTDSVKLVPMSKVSTAKEPLEKIPPMV
ncbi:hypothetical protein Tco_1549740, partial [Tanacetum coccineum]